MATSHLRTDEIAKLYDDFPDDGGKQAEVYKRRYKAYRRGKRRHAAERENFYLLCMMAHGDFNVRTLNYRDDYYDNFDIYRATVHPDYYINPALPILEFDDYLRWYWEQKGIPGELRYVDDWE